MLYQAWAFAAAGLSRQGKRLPVALLIMGAGWAYEIALPEMFRFPDGVSGVLTSTITSMLC